jgi:pyruvate formate lyase activating enzyme
MHNDPIEKKPFFHVYPGSRAFSIATVGCNIECRFCQNWEISQANPDDVRVPFMPPAEVARAAVREKCRTVAYTYSEPTIYWEYMADCARAARDLGLGNVVVSNGFIAERPLRELCGLVSAIKIDFKAFSEKFYADVCSGQFEPVKRTLLRLSDSGVWYEIVVLLIPGMNDGADEVRRMAAWVVKELGPDVPLHFTRFHPEYKLRDLPPTPPASLYRARSIAMAEGCRFVYTGNMPGGEGDSTYCPQCHGTVVQRVGFWSVSPGLKEGKCHPCGAAIPGLWN